MKDEDLRNEKRKRKKNYVRISGNSYGTVYNDAVNQGKAAYHLAAELAEGRIPTDEAIGYEITDGRYVWIPYRPLPGDAEQ